MLLSRCWLSWPYSFFLFLFTLFCLNISWSEIKENKRLLTIQEGSVARTYWLYTKITIDGTQEEYSFHTVPDSQEQDFSVPDYLENIPVACVTRDRKIAGQERESELTGAIAVYYVNRDGELFSGETRTGADLNILMQQRKVSKHDVFIPDIPITLIPLETGIRSCRWIDKDTKVARYIYELRDSCSSGSVVIYQKTADEVAETTLFGGTPDWNGYQLAAAQGLTEDDKRKLELLIQKETTEEEEASNNDEKSLSCTVDIEDIEDIEGVGISFGCLCLCVDSNGSESEGQETMLEESEQDKELD